MANSFGFRQDHLMNFMQWAEITGADPFEIFSMYRLNCCQDCAKTGCGVSWAEYEFQVKDRPSRMTLANRLFQAETMIGNYLKTPVGPTYIHHEMHTVVPRRKDNKIIIETNYRNVLKTGTQVLTRIGEGLEHTRTFVDRRNWGFTDDIIYCLGSEADPLRCNELERCDIQDLCNLRVYQPGYGPINQPTPTMYSYEDSCFTDCHGNVYTIGTVDTLNYAEDWTSAKQEFRHGHRIRPFHATYNGSRLCIQVNKLHNAKLNLYSGFPISSKKGALKDLDFCDEDVFPEDMEVYSVSYEKPDGVAYLRKVACDCYEGCDACEMKKVPICLEAIDPVSGEFQVVPIKNIGPVGEEPCCEPCCWVKTTWGECCYDLYGDPNICGCDIPVVVCINYLASACGNWQDCCIPDEVCPDLKASVAYLAASMFGSVCNCGCLDDLFQRYSEDMMVTLASLRSGSAIYAAEKAFTVFGNTRGAYEAYNQIRHRNRVRPIGNYMIG